MDPWGTRQQFYPRYTSSLADAMQSMHFQLSVTSTRHTITTARFPAAREQCSTQELCPSSRPEWHTLQNRPAGAPRRANSFMSALKPPPPVPRQGGVGQAGGFQTPTRVSRLPRRIDPSPMDRIRQIYQSPEVHRDTASNSDKMTTQQELKRYNPRDRTLKIVNRRDDITLDDDPDTLRAEMSCGHAVSPETLTAWCQSLLDKGQYKFTCPALKDGGNRKCGKEWPYVEVRKMAVLTNSERRRFEETMAALTAANFHEYKSCPRCQSSVERKNLSNLNVRCTVCTAEKGRTYEFCWQCLRKWKGPAPRSDRCDNKGCTNKSLDLLQKCPMTILPDVKNVQCPSIRACPTCGLLIEHDKKNCKKILCTRCQKEFCFVCLKLAERCYQTSRGYYLLCSDGVAPRQTSIPTWKT